MIMSLWSTTEYYKVLNSGTSKHGVDNGITSFGLPQEILKKTTHLIFFFTLHYFKYWFKQNSAKNKTLMTIEKDVLESPVTLMTIRNLYFHRYFNKLVPGFNINFNCIDMLFQMHHKNWKCMMPFIFKCFSYNWRFRPFIDLSF